MVSDLKSNEKVEIEKAFRLAALYSHPDKRNAAVRDLWPTMIHLEDSKDLLSNDCQSVLGHFNHFPSTTLTDRTLKETADPSRLRRAECSRSFTDRESQRETEAQRRMRKKSCQCCGNEAEFHDCLVK